jgi:hypothetical protein
MQEPEMKRYVLGRWVASVAVLAALAVGMISTGGRYTTQEIFWNSPAISGVLR